MSGVFARNRKETKMQFFVTGMELQVEILKFIMKENNIPKKWRYFIGLDVAKSANKLMENIISANTIYPVNEHELQIRKDYQTQAIICCYQLQNYILCLKECIDTVKMDKLTKVIDLLYEEVNLLKAWKKSSKIIK